MNYEIMLVRKVTPLFDIVTTYAVTKNETLELKRDIELLQGQLN